MHICTLYNNYKKILIIPENIFVTSQLFLFFLIKFIEEKKSSIKNCLNFIIMDLFFFI